MLLSGTNFDDTTERTTGGCNGLGSKLTNIFSTKMEVKICDGSGQEGTFTWTGNMSEKPRDVPVRLRKGGKRSFTQVTFWPDLARFGLDALPPGFGAVARRRLLDLAACAQLRVHLNGEKLPIQGFADYVRALGPVHVLDDAPAGKGTTAAARRAWRVAVLPRPEPPAGMDESPGHVSFVNNLWTPGGGSHVRDVQWQVTQLLADALKKRKVEMRGGYELNRYLLLVVSATVVNPTFNSQAKEALGTAVSKFGSRWSPSPAFKKALTTCEPLLAALQASIEKKQTQAMNRGGGKKRTVVVDKLQDAALAGTAKSEQCALVLTEGDSAKTLAVAGIPNSREYGVFAMRGVCLNVRGASKSALAKNKELQNLVKILGLEWGKAYATAADRAALRYGRIIVMADQDYDGFHITGLILNIFDVLWPDLLLSLIHI